MGRFAEKIFRVDFSERGNSTDEILQRATGNYRRAVSIGMLNNQKIKPIIVAIIGMFNNKQTNYFIIQVHYLIHVQK